jgi:hypothetical protein
MQRGKEMTIKQITRMIRICDHDAEPMDISVHVGGGINPMFFEIEQDLDKSIVVSIDGLRALLNAAKQLQQELGK